MCLLDEVVEASPEAIACLCRSHRDLANPLRRAGRLGAACGVEIASQAMALHGALAGHGRSAAGMLVSLRALDLKVPRLDLVASLSKSRNESLSSLNQTSTLKSLGVQLNVPLFSGGAVDASVKQSESDLARIEQEFRAEIESVEREVQRAYVGVATGATPGIVLRSGRDTETVGVR